MISVRTERLDDALDDAYAPTLIKIDVEGAASILGLPWMPLVRRQYWIGSNR